MHRKASMLCMLAALLSFGSVAFAQEQTVSIQGVVKDASGAVLPGATVEARNPLAGTNTAVTNADGVYRFPALPPGKYEITSTLQGFKPTKLTDTVLELGKNLVIDLTMALASVTEEVSVTAESSPIIDVKGNAATASITRSTIERMPKGRDFTTILRQAPGAQAESKSGGTQIDGASGSENRFVIDGMDTTNLQTGVSGKTMLLDFVDEVQVKSSGYNAEFGGATGGVVNVLTKSGTNAFHGQVGTYYQTEDMYGSIRPQARFNPIDSNLAETGMITPDNSWTYYSPVADIGGPLLRDRLWFYGGAAYTKNENANDVTFRTDVTKTQRHFESWDDAKYYNYNLTGQLSNNLRVKFSGSNQRNASRGTLPTLQPDNAVPLAPNAVYPNGVPSAGMSLSTFDANPDGSINQTAFNNRWINQGDNRENDSYSGNVDWIVKPSFFVNITGGVYRTDRTTPEEFRGDEIRHTLAGSSNFDSVMTAEGFPTVPDAVPAAAQLHRTTSPRTARCATCSTAASSTPTRRCSPTSPAVTCSRPASASSDSRTTCSTAAPSRRSRCTTGRSTPPRTVRRLPVPTGTTSSTRSAPSERCTRTTTRCGSRTPGTPPRA